MAAELGLGFLGLGFTPLWRRDEVPVMPKGRYKIMRNYMPKVGGQGLDMMFRTCTVQANLDFADEADMVAKFRVSLALQPIVTALFANSPFTEGKPNGFLSARANVWTDTDADRTGHAELRVRGRLRLRDLRPLRAPGADVFRQARGPLHRRRGQVLPRLHGRPPGRRPGRAGDDQGLGRPHQHDLPRGAPQAVPRDARRGRGIRIRGSAPCRRCGRASSTTRRPRRRRGTCASTGPWRTAPP